MRHVESECDIARASYKEISVRSINASHEFAGNEMHSAHSDKSSIPANTSRHNDSPGDGKSRSDRLISPVNAFRRFFGFLRPGNLIADEQRFMKALRRGATDFCRSTEPKIKVEGVK